MLTKYIQAAMHQAKYKILSDDDTLYGEIPGFQGVWANAGNKNVRSVIFPNALTYLMV